MFCLTKITLICVGGSIKANSLYFTLDLRISYDEMCSIKLAAVPLFIA